MKNLRFFIFFFLFFFKVYSSGGGGQIRWKGTKYLININILVTFTLGKHKIHYKYKHIGHMDPWKAPNTL